MEAAVAQGPLLPGGTEKLLKLPLGEHAQRVVVVVAIPLKIKVVLGSAVMSVRDVSGLRPGSLLTLDRKLGQPVDVTVNDRLICRGEIAVTDDAAPRFVIKIVELASGSPPGRSGK